MSGPDREAVERGLRLEREAAEVLGLSLVPGSGNKPHALSDLRGRLRVSCKSTKSRTWGETMRQLAEAGELAQSTGEVPALLVEVPESGERVLLMYLDDAAEVLTDTTRAVVVPRRSASVREAASVPALLRGAEEES